MKEFIIDKISRDTLEELGYDSSEVSDEMMEKIAEILKHTFRESVLACLPKVCDGLDIPEANQRPFIVSRVYFSLNDEDGNSEDVRLFKTETTLLLS